MSVAYNLAFWSSSIIWQSLQWLLNGLLVKCYKTLVQLMKPCICYNMYWSCAVGYVNIYVGQFIGRYDSLICEGQQQIIFKFQVGKPWRLECLCILTARGVTTIQARMSRIRVFGTGLPTAASQTPHRAGRETVRARTLSLWLARPPSEYYNSSTHSAPPPFGLATVYS